MEKLLRLLPTLSIVAMIMTVFEAEYLSVTARVLYFFIGLYFVYIVLYKYKRHIVSGLNVANGLCVVDIFLLGILSTLLLYK